MLEQSTGVGMGGRQAGAADRNLGNAGLVTCILQHELCLEAMGSQHPKGSKYTGD